MYYRYWIPNSKMAHSPLWMKTARLVHEPKKLSSSFFLYFFCTLFRPLHMCSKCFVCPPRLHIPVCKKRHLNDLQIIIEGIKTVLQRFMGYFFCNTRSGLWKKLAVRLSGRAVASSLNGLYSTLTIPQCNSLRFMDAKFLLHDFIADIDYTKLY